MAVNDSQGQWSYVADPLEAALASAAAPVIHRAVFLPTGPEQANLAQPVDTALGDVLAAAGLDLQQFAHRCADQRAGRRLEIVMTVVLAYYGRVVSDRRAIGAAPLPAAVALDQALAIDRGEAAFPDAVDDTGAAVQDRCGGERSPDR